MVRHLRNRNRPLRNSKKGIKQRAEAIRKVETVKPDAPTSCAVKGCPNPRLDATNEGIGALCRKHLDHYRRHGHPTEGRLKAWYLTPFRRAAYEFIREAARDRPKSRRRDAREASSWIVDALQNIEARLATAGLTVPANNLRGMLPEDKARIVWARLRDRDVDPVIILAIALGVHAALSVYANPPRWQGARRDWFLEFPEGPAIEYALCQMAKLLIGMGGGTVKQWRRTSAPGKVIEIRAFPVSAGRVLRQLGADLWRDTRLAAQHHVGDMLTKKAELSTPLTKLGKTRVKNVLSRPYPQRKAAVKWTDRAAVVTVSDDGFPQGDPRRPPKAVEVVEVARPVGGDGRGVASDRKVSLEIRRY